MDSDENGLDRSGGEVIRYDDNVAQSVIRADDGECGATQEMHGATAEDTILEVPVGTLVTDMEDGDVICDLTTPGQEHILCQ